MSGTKCLIVTHGFFGDIIFASSIAKRLRHENQFSFVDYLIGFPQVARLVKNNPYVNDVYVSEIPLPSPTHSKIDVTKYDRIVKLEPLSFLEPPTIEFQKHAGVRNPVASYRVYTDIEYDIFIRDQLEENTPFDKNKKTIAIMRNWKPKTYLFTKEEYDRGIDVPNLGYGGKHRNVEWIVDKLQNKFNVIFIGVDPDISQYDTQYIPDNSPESILFQCSLIKYCDAFVGTEGGLCNLAAGLGVKTIITGDYVHQLYGPNGVIKKIEEPKLGPKYYFPGAGHVTLDPFLTDEEVYEQIIEFLK